MVAVCRRISRSKVALRSIPLSLHSFWRRFHKLLLCTRELFRRYGIRVWTRMWRDERAFSLLFRTLSKKVTGRMVPRQKYLVTYNWHRGTILLQLPKQNYGTIPCSERMIEYQSRIGIAIENVTNRTQHSRKREFLIWIKNQEAEKIYKGQYHKKFVWWNTCKIFQRHCIYFSNCDDRNKGHII